MKVGLQIRSKEYLQDCIARIANINKSKFCSDFSSLFMTQYEPWMRECELNKCSLLFKDKLKRQLNILGNIRNKKSVG